MVYDVDESSLVSARLAAKVIEAYVDKQRRAAHNLPQVAKESKPAEANPSAAHASASSGKTTPAGSPKSNAVGHLRTSRSPIEMAALWTAPAHHSDASAKLIPARVAAEFPVAPGTTLHGGSFLIAHSGSDHWTKRHSERSEAK